MKFLKSQSQNFSHTRDCGITLVALIITIIILIILAAVTINSLTHDGLADLAVKSTQDYQREQTNEMEKLNEIDTMVKETLKNIEDGTITPPAPTDPDEPDSPTTPSQSIEETKEIASNNVGTTVDFTPASNTYNVEAIYSGYTSDQSWSTSDYTGTWSVWGTDDDYIYIISTTDTSKTLYLQGVLGYNNGVTLLDTLCDTCFTDKTTYPGSAAQNLKVEQVLAVKASSIANSAGSVYGTQPYSYTFTYPYIWNQYEKSANNSVNNRSKAYALTTQTTAASQSYAPYYTLWYNSSMNTSSAWVNSNYYSMVMTPAQSRTYWLSSRYVGPNGSSFCWFGLQYVNSSGVYYYDHLYYYNSGSTDSSTFNYAVRPLVSFPLADYAIDNSGDTIKIVKRS